METKTLLQILDKHVDQKGLAVDLVKLYVEPKVREYVAKSENKIDDAVLEGALALITKILAE